MILGEKPVNYLTVGSDQAEITALETVCQTRVSKTQQVQDGCIEIVNVHRAARDVETEVAIFFISKSVEWTLVYRRRDGIYPIMSCRGNGFNYRLMSF
jgi:hypothetical protein